ncbi:hypothetical protein PENTCL1PPCAC_2832 [Pristionchus entomophagus]|uniref:Brinker DNA-binding domain-containing protein n=1 Tax=Pristionchus entomophagus TaxID=358040 RepID=A0AAV5SDP6_9BILA|nr:hypothetical protein PENTCL1PPCAC_2832 [Pristionchus entomophagus]
MTMEKTGCRKRRREGSSTPPPRTLKQYSVEEKLDIIDYAKNTGNRAAGREFNVAESSIREWRKHEIKLRETLVNGGGNKTNPSAPSISNIRIASSLRSFLPALTTLPIKSVSSSSSSSPSSDISTTPSSTTSSVDSEVSGSRKRKATAPRKIVLDE